MNRAEFVFTLIDTFMNPLQNGKKARDINFVKDYKYGDDKMNRADFYYPKTGKNFSVVVNMHGGGFVKGDKKYRRSFSEYFAREGFFVVNMNYRLAPKNIYPLAFFDVISMLNQLWDIADSYSLDLNKIILTGDSSGGYMATQTAAILHNKQLQEALGLPDCKIKPLGLISFCAMIDIKTALSKKYPFGLARCIAESISGIKLDKGLKQIDDFKYIKYFTPTDFLTDDFCKTLVVYSQQDMLCNGQGEFLYNKLKEHNIPVEEIHVSNFMDNHCYHLVRFSKNAKIAMQKAVSFAKQLAF